MKLSKTKMSNLPFRIASIVGHRDLAVEVLKHDRLYVNRQNSEGCTNMKRLLFAKEPHEGECESSK